MSRGPGRMMRAALAELAEAGYTTALDVAARARHDEDCGCGDMAGCVVPAGRARRFWCQMFDPERADLVSARRALRVLADHGEVRLIYVAGDAGGRVLCAYGFRDSSEATLRLPPRPEGVLPTSLQFVRAIERMRKTASDGNTYARAEDSP